MQKGVFRWIAVCTVLWIIVILLAGCGGSSAEQQTKQFQGEVLVEREMTEQELTWWIETGNCLFNMGLAEFVEDVPEPYIVIVADETLQCGNSVDVNGCGLEDKIVLTQNVEGQEVWHKHESCHVYDFWLNGLQSHQSNFWHENKTCVCQ